VQEITSNIFTPPYPLKTAVLFLIFNRPDTTKQVFEAIRQAKPPRLYIAADGPRAYKPREQEKCEEVRRIAINVDWDCEVKTFFRDKNLGCQVAVSSAIDWFFENEEEGVILEDDCLPSQSFFWFCEELLERYRDDMRIMHISGDNFQNGLKRGNATYYFSKISHIWGWATWRRAWKFYDATIGNFPQFKEKRKIRDVFDSKREQNYWSRILQSVYDGKIDTWDYQWNYTVWTQNALCVLPNINLVSNIGFGNDSTHTIESTSKFADMPTIEMSAINHPDFMLQNKEADRFTFNSHFSPRSSIMLRGIKKIIK